MTTTLAENTARFKATPPPRSLLHSGKPHKIAALARFCMRAAAAVRQAGSARGCTRIAFVGDVHGDWSAEDEAALRFLDVDTTVFVGDFGNEDVDLVKQVAAGETPRLVMFGNHDAWNSLTAKRRPEEWDEGGDLSKGPAAPVMAQMAAVGERLLAWNCKPLPDRPVSFIGGRPFSKGGPSWDAAAEFYQRVFGCESRADSVQRTLDAMLAAPKDHVSILVAHSGPKGLGQRPQDICGVDFHLGSKRDRTGLPCGDWGDPDLHDALQSLWSQERNLAMIAFGHMHHKLQNPKRGRRIMIRQHQQRGTLYLNTAVVPRIKEVKGKSGRGGERMHQFTVVECSATAITDVASVWVGAVPGSAEPCREVSRQQLYRMTEQGSQLWNEFEQRWDTGCAAHALQQPAGCV